MTKQEEELIGHIVNNSYKIKYENGEYSLNGLVIKLNYDSLGTSLEIGGITIDMYDQGYLATIESVLQGAKKHSKNDQIEDIIQRINN